MVTYTKAIMSFIVNIIIIMWIYHHQWCTTLRNMLATTRLFITYLFNCTRVIQPFSSYMYIMDICRAKFYEIWLEVHLHFINHIRLKIIIWTWHICDRQRSPTFSPVYQLRRESLLLSTQLYRHPYMYLDVRWTPINYLWLHHQFPIDVVEGVWFPFCQYSLWWGINAELFDRVYDLSTWSYRHHII